MFVSARGGNVNGNRLVTLVIDSYVNANVFKVADSITTTTTPNPTLLT